MAFLSTEKKVMAPNRAAAWAKRQRTSKKRVVFTNGCFDLLHAGHLAYLEEARKQGDSLIVALNTDASVRRLKGPSRPLNTLKDRARVLAGLACVDAVTWFPEDTPAGIIRKVLPKVLVKGGDWAVDKIVGADIVMANGGVVKSLSFVKGKSTTKIIQRARRK